MRVNVNARQHGRDRPQLPVKQTFFCLLGSIMFEMRNYVLSICRFISPCYISGITTK